MTLRERIALAGFAVGFVLAVAAGVGFGGWAGGCAVGAVVLLAGSFMLGYGDPADVAAELASDEEDGEWRVYDLRGDDDAGAPPHMMPPHAAAGASRSAR